MLQDNPLWHRFTARLHLLVAMLVALVLTVILAVSAGSGDMSEVAMVMMALGCIALVLMLGDKYWMLIPFAFSSQLPAFPIRGRLLELPEIVAVLCSLALLVRCAVKRQKFSLFRKQHAPFLLYVGWVAFIFLLHPIGFSGLADSGAGLGGARFYAKILMALASFLIMANQEVTEKDCKWIIVLLLVGTVLAAFWQIGIYFLPGLIGTYVDFAEDPDSFYSWQQSLAIVPILLLGLGFARYKASELFSLNRLWAAIGFVLCVVLIALSGKRAALASVPMFAIAAALMRREWGFLLLWLAGAILAGGIIVLGHGEFFRFPLTIQRAFSALPAQWDSDIGSMEAGLDPFRAELRRQALKKIALDPWIGEGYKIDLSVGQALSAQYATRGGDIELQVMPFAMSSSWHNTWLGYAADFGIPLSIIAALIFFAVIRASYRLAVRFPPRSMRATLAAYLFLTTVVALIRSQTSGHSANDAFEHWWAFGALVSLGIAYARSSGGALLSLNPYSSGSTTRLPDPSLPGSRPKGALSAPLVSGNSRR